jgi:hypothetical protein
MEELKLLVGMVADLPSMALWVIAFFFAYKVTIIGSVYGVIRFVVEKAHNAYITRKTLPPAVQEISLEDKLKGICITSDSTLNLLLLQIQRVRGKRTSFENQNSWGFSEAYIHTCSVDWLREAITEKEERDKEEKQKGAKNGM